MDKEEQIDYSSCILTSLTHNAIVYGGTIDYIKSCRIKQQ